MAEYKDCYVAFFDVLGFKDLLTHASCDDVVTLFEKAKQFHYWTHKEDSPTNPNNENAIPIIAPDKINIKIVSDSICIFVESQVPNSLPGLIATCASYQAKMLELRNPVLLRGGISRGNLYYDGDIIFGPGLTEAYLLESKNAKYPRVILTEQLFNECDCDDDGIKGFARGLLLKDFDSFYVLNYFMIFCWMGAASRQKEIDNAYRHIQNVLAKTTDESIRSKYLYLNEKIQYYYNEMKAKAGQSNV